MSIFYIAMNNISLFYMVIVFKIRVIFNSEVDLKCSFTKYL